MLDHKIEQVIIDSLLLTKDGVGIFDADDRLVFCNEALEMLLGIPAEKALNQTFSALCFRCFASQTGINIEADCFDIWMNASQSKRRSRDYRTFETDTVEGKHFIVTEQIVQQHFLYMYITDITEKKQNEQKLTLMSQELQKLATTDYLTGIYNRRYFYETAKVEFSRSQREATKLSVLMLDLDKFKGINDSYGHNAGDLVLQTFAYTVGGLLRDYDTFARIGGEEFAILLPATDIILATKIAERIRQAIHSLQIKFEDQTLTFTTSIGLLESTTQISSFEQMMQIADKYLNQAKSDGRNKILCG